MSLFGDHDKWFKEKWLGSVLIAMLFCPSLVNAQAGFLKIDPSQPPETFIAITAKLKKPALIRADFKQAKYLKVLKKPFLSSGQFVFSRQKGVYWEIKQPLQNAFVISDQGIRSLKLETAQSMPPSSPISDSISRIFSSIIGGDIERLGDTFDVFHLDDPVRWTIQLKPKDPIISKVIAEINLSGLKVIEAIKIVEKTGDYTDIHFSNMINDGKPLSVAELEYFSD